MEASHRSSVYSKSVVDYAFTVLCRTSELPSVNAFFLQKGETRLIPTSPREEESTSYPLAQPQKQKKVMSCV